VVTPHHIALDYGSSIHVAMEEMNNQLFEKGSCNVADVFAKFDEYWIGLVSDENKRALVDATNDEIYDCAEEARLHLEAILKQEHYIPAMKPEKRIVSPLKHPITGYEWTTPRIGVISVIDLITNCDFGLKVTDYKTSKERYQLRDTESSLQFSCYSYALGEDISAAHFVFVKRKQLKNGMRDFIFQRIPTERALKDRVKVYLLFDALARTIISGAYYPRTDKDTFWQCRYCGHKIECDAYCNGEMELCRDFGKISAAWKERMEDRMMDE